MPKKEPTVQDLVRAKTSDCVDFMFNRCPTIDSITIPREVLDRQDINISSKLLYGLIYRFKHGMSMRVTEISGLLAMNRNTVMEATKELEQKGLITFKRRWRDPTHQVAPFYRAIVPPKRFEGYVPIPKFAKNKIDNIEKDVDEYFDEIKLK